MNESSITIGGRIFKVLTESDLYGRHLINSYIDDSAKLRNFLYTHYDSGSDYKIADIGANIGYTSRMINELLPKALIHSFEPSPEVYALLQDNTMIIDNIVAINKAIADQESIISFASNSAYGHIAKGGSESSCKVHCTTLSSFAALEKINKYDFVKVDVEGFELDVFKGIGGIADVVFFEFNPWTICHHYEGNPLEVIREIMDEWIIFRFASKTKLEQVDNANTLVHDTIVYKPLDDFIALRKEISNQVTIKTRLKRHVLRDELIGCMYKGILGRNADLDGLNHYMNKYKNLSDADLVSSLYLDFVDSEEFNSTSY